MSLLAHVTDDASKRSSVHGLSEIEKRMDFLTVTDLKAVAEEAQRRVQAGQKQVIYEPKPRGRRGAALKAAEAAGSDGAKEATPPKKTTPNAHAAKASA